MTPINLKQILESPVIPNDTVIDSQEEIIPFFQNRYGFEEQKSFQRIWNKIGAQVWKTEDPLTAGTIRTIDAKFRKELIYHGKGIPAPESLSNGTVHKLVQSLLHGKEFSFLLIEERTAKAIFIAHDKELMQEFQRELQLELNNLALHPPKNDREEIVWRAFLGNVIALLPYAYPHTDDIFTIPLLQNGTCRQVDYHTEIIPLSFNKHSSPMTALGFTSDDPTAPSILSFTGTTYPAGKGFATTLLADFTPGHSVGEIIYKRNRKQIDHWLAGKKDVHVVGMSLGGAMAFHTLRFHHGIARVDAYNPPGLYLGNWKRGAGATCSVNIYCQPGDTVSKQGYWPTGDNISLYTVYPHQKGVKEDAFNSHAKVFSGCEKISLVKDDPVKENRSFTRYLRTKAHQFFGPIVVFIPLLCTLFLYRIARSVHRAALFFLSKLNT